MVELPSRPGYAVAVVLCVVLGSLGLVAGLSAPATVGSPGAHPNLPAAVAPAVASKGSPSGSATGVAKALALEAAMRAKGISPNTVHLPNFAGAVTDTAQPIQPSYTQAPAPMGVADIGLENQSGTLVPYELNTTSVAGTVNITNLESLYLDGDGPDTYGIQLNSVVTGVTIFGNSSYEFWSQNYIDYTVSTDQLVFGDEVWNFSSPSGYFPTNSVYGFSPNGTFSLFPFLYQGYGPAITIGYPFSLTLYLNTSTIADRPALYFNYTVSNSTFSQSSSFDYLIFNSSIGAPTAAAPTPYYQADGYNYDPIGLINDMEIDLLGNDDGDTTAFLAADATISLEYWNASAGQMQEVPSAFSAGQETGETSVGLLVYSSGGPNPIAIVRSGPGLVGGLWNYSGRSGAVADTVTVHPVNEYSFLFVNVGSAENASTAQWVPTSTTGSTTFYLPTGGTYFLDFMMSDYDPASLVVTATGSVTLTPVHLTADPSVGVYTPLFAFTNGELAALATSGAGIESNPYIIQDDQYGSLAPQFAQWDDYLFPIFPGLLFAGTTAWVDVTPPSFEIDLPSWAIFDPFIAALGLPLTNDLQLEFYDASNISLVGATGISGWMSEFQFGYPESQVILWNCTNMLVASNTFDDQGNALLLYGGTNNTVWGNSFVTSSVAAANPGSVDDSSWITGVNETESGDLLYNNLFDVALPAITPTADPFQCDQYGYCYLVAYNDTWNVSDQPADDVSVVNGMSLTGSIVGTSYQGGNYWSNYGSTLNPYGVLPYNSSGAIYAGGDFVPLVPFTLFPVTFNETGLSAGVPWNVTENGVLASSSSASIGVESPNGTFSLIVGAPAGYTAAQAPPEFTVDGAAVVVDITFIALVPVYVTASGLPLQLDLIWSAYINGTGTGNTAVTQSNTTFPAAIILFDVPAGSYNVSAIAVGFTPTPTMVTVTVASPVTYVAFAFTPNPGLLTLSVTPASASVLVDGNAVVLTNGNGSEYVPAGVTSIEATNSGYRPYFANVTLNSSAGLIVAITLLAIQPATLSLTVSPASAGVRIDGTAVTLTSGAYDGQWAPGVHSIEVTASGYYAYYNNVSVTSGATTTLMISLHAVSTSSNSTSNPTGTSGIDNAGWAAIVVLAALALVCLIGLIYFARRRPPQSTTGGSTSPPQPWQETHADQEAPPPK